MPNWVDNTLVVTGDKDDVRAFVDQAARPHEHPFGGTVEEKLSFWNFVRPDDSIMHEYMGEEPRNRTLAEAMLHDTNHWYDWNIRNWGCKWDAKVMDATIEDGYASYAFDTPWGEPQLFFEAIVKQFPNLDFNLRFVEEQGWGGELGGSGGQLFKIAEWDIPATHEDSMEYTGSCRCEALNDDEVEWMFDDCTRKMALTNA